jgi:hypothetical protein
MSEKVTVFVFDEDLVGSNDFLGSMYIDLKKVQLEAQSGWYAHNTTQHTYTSFLSFSASSEVRSQTCGVFRYPLANEKGVVEPSRGQLRIKAWFDESRGSLGITSMKKFQVASHTS